MILIFNLVIILHMAVLVMVILLLTWCLLVVGTDLFFGRDEIYCQICKQLVENKGTRSRMQGWILLSVCLGIFPPTDLFMKVSALQVNSSLSILTHSANYCSRGKKNTILTKILY